MGGWGGSAFTGSVTPAADVFSLAILAFELWAGHQLLPVRSNLHDYRAKLAVLGTADMAGVHPALQGEMKGG